MSRPPHFLGIGAQKAATTWLDGCLRRHPEIWLPPLKELHYFDDLDDGGVPGGRPLLGSRWSGRRLRRQLAPRFRSDVRHLDISRLRWDLRFFFGRRSDAWYLSLFPEDPGSVAGEITPDYSALDDAGVARVHAVLPDIKLIFLMRDPIDRSWSQMRMDLARTGRKIGDVPIEELTALARSDRVSRRSDYVRTLQNWGTRYADERFFIGFLEDVGERPEGLLADLCRFLGVDPSPAASLPRRGPRAPGRDEGIPEAVERELARLHLDGLRVLEARFGGPVIGWRRRAEGLAR